MNAYELAEIIEDDMEDGFGMGFLKDAVAMLRQQADELTEAGGMIGVLREKVSLQADYIVQLEKGLESSIAMNKAQAERQVKELTDEEITDVFVECLLPDGEFDEHEFARAILRKAQEK